MNNKYYIEIKKNSWKNSLDLLFIDVDMCEYINLFLLLKSYLVSTKLIVYKMYIILINNEYNSIIIYKNINIYLLYKMNFIEFFEWYKNNFEYDYEYVKKHQICGIRIVFNSDNNDNIFPIYPWNENWKNMNNV